MDYSNFSLVLTIFIIYFFRQIYTFLPCDLYDWYTGTCVLLYTAAIVHGIFLYYNCKPIYRE